jgi:hypothetical protein
MGNLSPAMNEDLARSHAADLYAQAERWRQRRAVRDTQINVAGRWRSRLGWALVQVGFGLLVKPNRSAWLRASSLERLGGPGKRRHQPTIIADNGACNG